MTALEWLGGKTAESIIKIGETGQPPTTWGRIGNKEQQRSISLYLFLKVVDVIFFVLIYSKRFFKECALNTV